MRFEYIEYPDVPVIPPGQEDRPYYDGVYPKKE